MKNANLKLGKLPTNYISTPSIQVKRNSGEPIGLILSSGEFVPVDGIEIYVDEMVTILNVMENFNLFIDNLKD